MLSFLPRGVLDEILNLIESVSWGFPSYSYIRIGFFLDVMNRDVIPGVGTSGNGLCKKKSPQCRAYTWALQIKKNPCYSLVPDLKGHDYT